MGGWGVAAPPVPNSRLVQAGTEKGLAEPSYMKATTGAKSRVSDRKEVHTMLMLTNNNLQLRATHSSLITIEHPRNTARK